MAVSESVLTAATATYVLPKIAQVLRLAGDEANATRAEAFAAGQRNAILPPSGTDTAGASKDAAAGNAGAAGAAGAAGEAESAWNGQWLRRAWCGNITGGHWVGDTSGEKPGVFTPQHGFAMLGGVFDAAPKEMATVVSLLKSRCRSNDFPFGFPYRCEAKVVGEAACPGMWPALDHPLLLGLARMNETELAWEEWMRNSLHWQTNVTGGKQWVGQWTSADAINNDGSPGVWTNNYPVLCMHRHAWPLVSIQQLMGVQFSTTGVVVKPSLPASLGSYSFASPIASIEYVASSEVGHSFYHGNYTAMSSDHWDVSIDLSLRHPGVIFEVRVRWLAQTLGGSHTGAASVAVVAEASMNGTDLLSVAAPPDTAAYVLDFTIWV
jgi:hypothetical protein